MPPVPRWPSSLYLPRKKPLCRPFEQLVGLPAGDDLGLDQLLGQRIGVFDRGPVVLQGGQCSLKLVFLDQPAALHEFEELFSLELGHCAVESRPTLTRHYDYRPPLSSDARAGMVACSRCANSLPIAVLGGKGLSRKNDGSGLPNRGHKPPDIRSVGKPEETSPILPAPRWKGIGYLTD